jgi:hypothetical protein
MEIRSFLSPCESPILHVREPKCTDPTCRESGVEGHAGDTLENSQPSGVFFLNGLSLESALAALFNTERAVEFMEVEGRSYIRLHIPLSLNDI